MSSSVNSLTSAAAALSAPQTSTTGTSTFSSDLQASVTRALEIASLPMQALQADQSTISGKTSELSTLSGLFGSLQTSLQAITSGTGTNALQAAVSDQSVVSANVTGNALAGTYTVQVLNAGSASSATQQFLHPGNRSYQPEHQLQHFLHPNRGYVHLHRYRVKLERFGGLDQLQRRTRTGCGN